MDAGKKKFLSILLIMAFAAVLAVTIILIWPVYRRMSALETEVEIKRQELSVRNAECIKLNREVNNLEHKPGAVEKVAREKFGLCEEGEVVLKYDADKAR